MTEQKPVIIDKDYPGLNGALDWWKKWKRFVLNTHSELKAVYHAEELKES